MLGTMYSHFKVERWKPRIPVRLRAVYFGLAVNGYGLGAMLFALDGYRDEEEVTNSAGLPHIAPEPCCRQGC